MTKQTIPLSVSGFCAEKHSEHALVYRIQKRNNKNRTFAFIVHTESISMFKEVINEDPFERSHTSLYVSEKGFMGVDQLFVIKPPDFLTFICPAFTQPSSGFDLLVSKVDRWMNDRFITTILSTENRKKSPVLSAPAEQDMARKLRKISSQLVWIEDSLDLAAILSALRFFD